MAHEQRMVIGWAYKFMALEPSKLTHFDINYVLDLGLLSQQKTLIAKLYLFSIHELNSVWLTLNRAGVFKEGHPEWPLHVQLCLYL